jgi:hypothetical protein
MNMAIVSMTSDRLGATVKEDEEARKVSMCRLARLRVGERDVREALAGLRPAPTS